MLYQSGVATGPDRSLFMVPAGVTPVYLEGSRVLDPAFLDPAMLPDLSAAPQEAVLRRIRGKIATVDGLSDALVAQTTAEESRAWLATGTVPGADGALADIGEAALLDLRALTGPNGAVLAAPSRQWRYVWPRDASFAAAAFARTGHPDDALKVLQFLQRVQGADGSFQARYRPNGSGPPDDRGIQDDGTGWALWATATLLASVDPTDRERILDTLAPLVERSTARILDLTSDGTHLPPPSSDYWEVASPTLTLGTAAPLLAGLEASGQIHAASRAWSPRAALSVNTAADAAQRLRALIEREFGDDGYARSIAGGARDAAVTFALPPYQPTPLTGAVDSWQAAVRPMLRPAGGISPGEGWRADGVSWTPQTALYALAAATSGTDEGRYEAQCWVTWIDDHRTTAGAIPEKVLADGSPAAVAPLAWTSALVVLTLMELEKGP